MWHHLHGNFSEHNLCPLSALPTPSILQLQIVQRCAHLPQPCFGLAKRCVPVERVQTIEHKASISACTRSITFVWIRLFLFSWSFMWSAMLHRHIVPHLGFIQSPHWSGGKVWLASYFAEISPAGRSCLRKSWRHQCRSVAHFSLPAACHVAD